VGLRHLAGEAPIEAFTEVVGSWLPVEGSPIDIPEGDGEDGLRRRPRRLRTPT
jgi:hypothetical protein